MKRLIRFLSHAIPIKTFWAQLFASFLLLLTIIAPPAALAQENRTSDDGMTIRLASQDGVALSMSGGVRNDSWVWSSRTQDAVNNPEGLWKFHLEDNVKGVISIRPKADASLCLTPEWNFNAQISQANWFLKLKPCSISSERTEQLFILQPTKNGVAYIGDDRDPAHESILSGEYVYLIKRANTSAYCLNVYGSPNAGRPVGLWTCQRASDNPSNDRFVIKSNERNLSASDYFSADAQKLAQWAELSTLYAINKADGTISRADPVEKTESFAITGSNGTTTLTTGVNGTATRVSGIAAYAAALFPGMNYGTVSNRTNAISNESKTWGAGSSSSFEWGLGQSVSFGYEQGAVDVWKAKFDVTLSANQSWANVTTTQSTFTTVLPVPPYSTGWLAMGQYGKIYTSKFDITTNLGDRFTTSRITATVKTSNSGDVSICNNQGVVDDVNQHLTGAYKLGDACLASWPAGVTAPTTWAPGVLHWANPPANHIYTENTAEPGSGASTPNALTTTAISPTVTSPIATPTATLSVTATPDGLQIGVNYKITVNTGTTRCLDLFTSIDNVGVWFCKQTRDDNQKWQFSAADSDGYRVIFPQLSRPTLGSSICIATSGDTDVALFANTCNTAAGRWKYNSSTHSFTNKAKGATMCLSAPMSDTVIGSGMRPCDSSTAQTWAITQ